MDWNLFMILMTVLIGIALILFGIYKIVQLVYKHKEKKYDEDIINLMESIYGIDNEKLEKLLDNCKQD